MQAYPPGVKAGFRSLFPTAEPRSVLQPWRPAAKALRTQSAALWVSGPYLWYSTLI